MGIKDLGRVVSKHAPSAVTPLSSLSDLRGRRVAIDANLLTQKIHFVTYKDGPMHPHRHAQAWYTFLRALDKEDIKPIVVFDGKARLPAKMNEVERRRAARTLLQQRASAEAVRGERLAAVNQAFGQLDNADRSSVLRALRAHVDVDQGPSTQSAKEWISAALDRVMEALHLKRKAAASAQEVDKTERTASSLLKLYQAARQDTNNPIYSRRQQEVKKEELAIYAAYLAEPDERLVESGNKAEWANLVERSERMESSLKRNSAPIPPGVFDEVIQLVDAMGIPYMQPSTDSPHEAEGLCATLHRQGLVDLVISEDTDVLAYGSPIVRRFTTRRRPVAWDPYSTVITDEGDQAAEELGDALLGTVLPGSMNILDADTLFRSLGMTREQFVDFALLCGTDFTQRIPKIGPITALKLIQQHGTIEAVLENDPKLLPANEKARYLETIQVARMIFLRLPPIPHDAKLDRTEPSSGLHELLQTWDIK